MSVFTEYNLVIVIGVGVGVELLEVLDGTDSK